MAAQGEASGAGRVSAAFERAVRREREAIAAHDRAAQLHDTAGALCEQRALTESDEVRREQLVEQAGLERARALNARMRAARARKRLADEGCDPDG
ncbi:MAG TPA: hypothetical protein VFM55_14810 [Micromonosporaceae bacterium]|nr:hypothetical protein [Micromonosporaceae bacterium]